MSQSAIAKLPESATTESAQAPVKHDFKDSVPACTGQYLWDRFVNDDKETVSKIGAVRLLAESVDTNTFKGAIKDMLTLVVETIKKEAGGNEETAKKTNGYKTAQVRASELRVLYGAFKYALKDMQNLGYGTETGYLKGVPMARQALKDAQIKWDGTADSDEAKARRLADRDRRAENKLLQEAMAENPRREDETLEDFAKRCTDAVQAKLSDAIAEEEAKQIESIAKSIVARNPDIAAKIAEQILLELQAH